MPPGAIAGLPLVFIDVQTDRPGLRMCASLAAGRPCRLPRAHSCACTPQTACLMRSLPPARAVWRAAPPTPRGFSGSSGTGASDDDERALLQWLGPASAAGASAGSDGKGAAGASSSSYSALLSGWPGRPGEPGDGATAATSEAEAALAPHLQEALAVWQQTGFQPSQVRHAVHLRMHAYARVPSMQVLARQVRMPCAAVCLSA